MCDGNDTVGDIVRTLTTELKTPIDEAAVWLALKQLRNAKLFLTPVPLPDQLSSASRRNLLRPIGASAVFARPWWRPSPFQTRLRLPRADEMARSARAIRNVVPDFVSSPVAWAGVLQEESFCG